MLLYFLQSLYLSDVGDFISLGEINVYLVHSHPCRLKWMRFVSGILRKYSLLLGTLIAGSTWDQTAILSEVSAVKLDFLFAGKIVTGRGHYVI